MRKGQSSPLYDEDNNLVGIRGVLKEPIKFQEDAISLVAELEQQDSPKVGTTDFQGNVRYPDRLSLIEHIKKQIPFLRVDPRTRMEFSPRRFETVSIEFDEVIKKANNQVAGLAGYVCTSSIELANKTSEALETGMVAVNTPFISNAETPFGGIKQSGYGREGGSVGIKDYLNIKYTHLGLSG